MYIRAHDSSRTSVLIPFSYFRVKSFTHGSTLLLSPLWSLELLWRCCATALKHALIMSQSWLSFFMLVTHRAASCIAPVLSFCQWCVQQILPTLLLPPCLVVKLPENISHKVLILTHILLLFSVKHLEMVLTIKSWFTMAMSGCQHLPFN